MSTKPATLPRWATDLTNNDAPSSGQMDTGWTPGQTGVSDYDNYIKYWTYKWCEYLNDGALTGPITITGDLDVTGDVTLGDNAGDTHTITGTVNHTGQLNSGTVVADAVHYGTWKQLTAVEHHVHPFLYDTDRDAGAPTFSGTSWDLSPGGALYIPIYLPVGCTIKSWTVRLYKTTDATKYIYAKLVRTDPTIAFGGLPASNPYEINATQETNANNPGLTYLTDPAANTTIAANNYYYLYVNATSGATYCQVRGASFTWTRE